MSIRKNTTALLGMQVATWLASLVAIIIVPNMLGTSVFGDFVFAMTFGTFFGVLAVLGTGTVLTREIAGDHEQLPFLTHNAIGLKRVFGAIVTVVGFLLAIALGVRGFTLYLVALNLVSACFLGALKDVRFSALAGLEIMRKPALLQALQVYAGVGLSLALLYAGVNLWIFATVTIATILIPYFGVIPMLRPYERSGQHYDWAIWKWMMRAGIPLMVFTALGMVYGQIDIPILQAVSGSETVAWYAIAYKWVGIPFFIVTALCGAMLPRLSAANVEDFARLMNHALRIVLIVVAPASLGLAFVADDLVTLLYKAEFDQAVPIIRILCVWLPILAVDTVLILGLIAQRRQRRCVVVAGLATLVNPLLAWVLIRWSDQIYANGAIGAAVATVVTEVIILGGALTLLSPGVLDRVTVLGLTRIAGATLAMVPFLVVLENSWLFLQVGVGMAAYAAAAWLLRVTSVSEVRELIRR